MRSLALLLCCLLLPGLLWASPATSQNEMELAQALLAYRELSIKQAAELQTLKAELTLLQEASKQDKKHLETLDSDLTNAKTALKQASTDLTLAQATLANLKPSLEALSNERDAYRAVAAIEAVLLGAAVVKLVSR